MSNPTPTTMLIEGVRDAIAALNLLRFGAIANVPMGDALNMIEVTIDELEYALSSALDTKVGA